MSRFTDSMNAQIANEFGASQQYIAIAVHYDAETLPQLAGHFYRQAVEERNHAMMLVQYLLDAGEEVRIPGIAEPRTAFATVAEPVELALAQERKVTEQITELSRIAREDGNALGEQFMLWFLKEQLEEMSSMTALLRTVERAADSNILLVEDQLARTSASAGAVDPTAPNAAGGAL
jgi:ferritin